MDENLHNIDDLFKKAINEHDELPSESVWENIDRNLDKKKVAFISKKYNKLKWIAAALLVFSAGMAMYTWHTKMNNQELVKQNAAGNKKQISIYKPKRANNKDIDTNLALTAKAEKIAPVKDTSVKQIFSDTNYLSEINTAIGNKKENNKNNTETAIAKKAEDLRNKLSKGSANRFKNEEKFVGISGENLQKEAYNEISEKGTEMLLNSKRQKDSSDNYSATFIKTNKEVIAGIEFSKPDFTIPQENAFLQNSLEKKLRNNAVIKLKETLTAQTLKTRNKAFRKPFFAVTAFYSPDFVSKRINNDHHRFDEDDGENIRNKEEVRSSSSVGILVSYSALKKLSIESGIVFSTLSTDIQPKLIYARPDDIGNIYYRFNCSAGYSYLNLHSALAPANGDSIPSFASKNILNYIAIPLTVKYKLAAGKFSVNPGLGIAVNFLTKGKIETVIKGTNGDEKANLDHIEGLNSMYVNSSLSAGMQYDVSKNFAISLTPAARFALTSINNNAPVKTFLNTYGLAAGLTLKL